MNNDNELYFPISVDWIDPCRWQDQSVPPREWLVEGLIPLGEVTLLCGDGGVGKSLLMQQLMTSVATNSLFLGQKTLSGFAIGCFCEDDAYELHRRQDKINQSCGVQHSFLDGMKIYCGVGENNTLILFDEQNQPTLTSLYHAIKEKAQEMDAVLIVIDTAADTFGGNENIRLQVRQFINSLSRLAKLCNAAVVLTFHPSVTGLAKKDGTGGSTAWNNTVRSRLYLERPEGGEEGNIRSLTTRKTNYGAIGDKIMMEWRDGVFEAQDSRDVFSQIKQAQQNKADDEAFLTCLDALTAQGRSVSHSSKGGNYAPKEMLNKPETKGMNKTRLIAAMERLFAASIIEVGEVGRGSDRKPRYGIKRRMPLTD